MGTIDISFLFSCLILAMGIHYTLYLLYIRARKGAIMKRYNQGTSSYENYAKLLDVRRLAASIIVTVGLVVNFAFSLRAVLGLNEQSSRYILIFAPVASILTLAIAFGGAYIFLRKK